MVIPTFNRYSMLESLLTNIYPSVDNEHLGIVVVDDCSSEKVVNKLKFLQKKLPRIEFFFNSSNKGAAKSRNIGAYHGKQSQWIWFFDDDDKISIETIEMVISSTSSITNNDILLLSSRSTNGRETKTTIPSGKFLAKRFRRYGHQVNTSCAVIKFDLFNKIGGWDYRLIAGQDTDLFLRLAKLTDAVVLDNSFVDVISHCGERITTNPKKQMIAKFQFIKKHWKFLHPARTLRYIFSILIFYPYLRKFL